jgi:hypothetical protein
MSSLPVPVSPVMSTEMSVVATFCSLRKTSIIDGHTPMISPKRLSFSSLTSFSLSARRADRSIAFWRMSEAWPAKMVRTSSCERSKRPFTRSLPTYIAPVTWPCETSGAHMTDDRRSARTLSLDPNCASVTASLTMTGRPVSRTRRTMLSEMAPVVSVMASRFTARDARITGLLPSGRDSPVNASSMRRMRPFSAPVTSMTASSIASSSSSIALSVMSFSLNS